MLNYIPNVLHVSNGVFGYPEYSSEYLNKVCSWIFILHGLPASLSNARNSFDTKTDEAEGLASELGH